MPHRRCQILIFLANSIGIISPPTKGGGMFLMKAIIVYMLQPTKFMHDESGLMLGAPSQEAIPIFVLD